MAKTLADLAPSVETTYWISSHGGTGGFVATHAIGVHESVGATDAVGLAQFCERIGVSYNAIVDLDGGGRIVYTVPRNAQAYHIANGANAVTNGICPTTPGEGYSRAEWLGPQRRKVEIVAWYFAVVCNAEQLDIIWMSDANIRDAVWNHDHAAGGVARHKDFDRALDDPTPHVDPRGFPMDVCIQWAQEAAGYSDWQTRDREPDREPEPTEPEPIPINTDAIAVKHEQYRDLIGEATGPVHRNPDGVGAHQKFELYQGRPAQAHIYWHPTYGAQLVYGAIMATYGEHRWEKGPFGYPLTDERDAPPDSGYDRWSGFENGWISWSQGEGATAHLHESGA